MEEIKSKFLKAIAKDPDLLARYSWVDLEKKFDIPQTSKPGDRARGWFRTAAKNDAFPGKPSPALPVKIPKDWPKKEEKLVVNNKRIKRLFFDIETSPNVGLFWRAGYKQTVPYENILQERAIICICYKWEGEDKVHSLYWTKDRDDKEMLEKFLKIANEADEMVGHNGDMYDLSFIRTRCLYHRLPMFPSYLTMDTLKVSRSKFLFNSNRLDYIASFLGFGEKIHTSFSMWKELILNNNKKTLNEMITYCKHDVILLEKVYGAFKNHIEPKMHFGVAYLKDRGVCPECGSDHLIIVKTRTTASGNSKKQFQCKDCGKYHSKNITHSKEEDLKYAKARSL